MEASVDIVSRVRTDDLSRATPCSEWTLADLLAHMTVQHHGFAAAARGLGDDPAVWRSRPAGPAEYAKAAEDVLAAFTDPMPEFDLPEFGARFPAAQAIGFHLVDYVVHGWDVARSLGVGYRLDPDVAEVALPIALAVPGGEARLVPGAAFGPALAAKGDADPLDRVLTLLGRSPQWRCAGEMGALVTDS
ncbi:MAG TPA: TIGR03086 family metal-binding protein [Lentzea sp.]